MRYCPDRVYLRSLTLEVFSSKLFYHKTTKFSISTPTNINPKNKIDDMKTSAVTIFGLQSYKDARLTLATARGIISSINIIPFIIGSSSIKYKTPRVNEGRSKNLKKRTLY